MKKETYCDDTFMTVNKQAYIVTPRLFCRRQSSSNCAEIKGVKIDEKGIKRELVERVIGRIAEYTMAFSFLSTTVNRQTLCRAIRLKSLFEVIILQRGLHLTVKYTIELILLFELKFHRVSTFCANEYLIVWRNGKLAPLINSNRTPTTISFDRLSSPRIGQSRENGDC